ncbi:MAG: cyclic lactone autoinducer peptide [Lachnospiraceae bacterium]|nr:cyclic lactone autoinducer peptide [Lachnospiraceae bacterium]
MKKENQISKFIVEVTTKVAAASAGEASLWYLHQPKEPEALRKFVEEKQK